ncbi:LacI family DNA-binding transcriptional regulator [Alkalihalobacillus sp. MEB130]|uniref:LacI family DNA-binding transcriptional regulator n=1 Tax=Alkalihalobacillus sp. MEB130 TaxID=2976704 RepID=UPI0028E01344|nr:LacI family DNA-binding transcriptional regulator [Alkalihalobacillus sp. MEB130]MDT8861629.1 LacI family DNA-binding transcriptional regulator [Alkalihalobacillus sp. MEB130]
MANIKDLAKMANVSVTTVSRVLNHHPYVSKEKREAVWEAVKQSNYQKNINAVHLSTGKTHLIGVVLPYSNHPYFGLLLDGIAQEAVKNNYSLVLIQTNYEEEREIKALDMLKHKQIDALIICSRICSWSTTYSYLEYGKIVFCEDTRQHPFSSTFVDHYTSFETALTHLYNKGHEKIGYCIGRKQGSNSINRANAYRDFLTKNQLPYRHDYIFDQCLFLQDGEKVMKQMKEMKEPPAALLVTSDQVAAGIATYCQNNNIVIPHELAIMGFDNDPISKVMGITTMEIPLVEMGKHLFIQSIQDEITYKEMGVSLIERNTV